MMLTRHRTLSVLAMAGFFLLVTLSLRFYPLHLPLDLEATLHMPTNIVPAYLYGEKVASEDYSSEYRRLLSTVSPLDRVPHSKTLGVASRIYVIGLPRREDRRASMEKLARAMGERELIYILSNG